MNPSRPLSLEPVAPARAPAVDAAEPDADIGLIPADAGAVRRARIALVLAALLDVAAIAAALAQEPQATSMLLAARLVVFIVAAWLAIRQLAPGFFTSVAIVLSCMTPLVSVLVVFALYRKLGMLYTADVAGMKRQARTGLATALGLKPVHRAPSLTTINGIGFTLYGHSDDDAATASFVATHYFVVLFVPVLPVGRYRVQQTGAGSYRFLGRAPLRAIDWLHMAAAVIGFALLVLSAAIRH